MRDRQNFAGTRSRPSEAEAGAAAPASASRGSGRYDPLPCPPDELAERLKDIAHELGAIGVEATFEVVPHNHWRRVFVRHAGMLDDSPDGWTVEVSDTEL